MSALLAFVVGLWIGTGWVWWLWDGNTARARFWRAVTFLPLTIWYRFFGIFDR